MHFVTTAHCLHKVDDIIEDACEILSKLVSRLASLKYASVVWLQTFLHSLIDLPLETPKFRHNFSQA